jgi:hypothetical protein
MFSANTMIFFNVFYAMYFTATFTQRHVVSSPIEPGTTTFKMSSMEPVSTTSRISGIQQINQVPNEANYYQLSSRYMLGNANVVVMMSGTVASMLC